MAIFKSTMAWLGYLFGIGVIGLAALAISSGPGPGWIWLLVAALLVLNISQYFVYHDMRQDSENAAQESRSLLQMAEPDRSNLAGWVFVRLTDCDVSQLGTSEPKVTFVFEVINSSIFDVHSGSFSGQVQCRDVLPNLEARVPVGIETLSRGRRATLRVHQPISSQTAMQIVKAIVERQPYEFNFAPLNVELVGRDPCLGSDVTARLGLPNTFTLEPKEIRIPDGVLLQGEGPAVYVICDGRKRVFPDPQTFEAQGLRWDRVVHVKEDCLASIPDGQPMPPHDSEVHP